MRAGALREYVRVFPNGHRRVYRCNIVSRDWGAAATRRAVLGVYVDVEARASTNGVVVLGVKKKKKYKDDDVFASLRRILAFPRLELDRIDWGSGLFW